MTSVEYLSNLLNSNESISQEFILKSREFLALKDLKSLKKWIIENKCCIEYENNLIESIYKERNNKWNRVIDSINIC